MIALQGVMQLYNLHGWICKSDFVEGVSGLCQKVHEGKQVSCWYTWGYSVWQIKEVRKVKQNPKSLLRKVWKAFSKKQKYKLCRLVLVYTIKGTERMKFEVLEGKKK